MKAALQQLAVFVTTVVWIQITGAAEAGALDKVRELHDVYSDLETFSGDKNLYNVTTMTTSPSSNVSLTAPWFGRKRITEPKWTLRLEASTSCNGFVAPIYTGKYGPQHDVPFMVAFDTGSSNTWVYGSTAEDPFFNRLPERRNRHNYGFSRSDTIQSEKKSFSYLDGSKYDGNLANGVVRIGPPPEQLDLGSIHFLAVSDYNQNPTGAEKTSEAIDGVVGLGTDETYSSEYSGMTTTVFQKLVGRHYMGQSPSFSFYVSASGKTGEIVFGGHNKQLLARGRKMVYFPQEEMTLAWSLKFERLGLAGGGCLKALKSCLKKKKGANMGAGTAIAKRTTAMLMTRLPLAFYMPFKVFENLVKDHYPSAAIVCDEKAEIDDPGMRFRDGDGECQNWFSLIIDCRLRNSLNDLVMEIGKSKFTFTGKEVFPGTIRSGEHIGQCSSFFGYMPRSRGEAHAGEYFHSAEDDEEGEMWAIGVGFMKKYYIEYRHVIVLDDNDILYLPHPSREIGIGLSKGKEIVERKKKNGDEEGGDKKNKKQRWGLGKRGKKKKKDETALVVEDDYGA